MRPAVAASSKWAALVCVGAAVLFGQVAGAGVTPTANALELARALAQSPATIGGAEFATAPPAGTPDGVSDTPLAGFPTSGSTYAVLTTGDATLAPTPNDAGNTAADDGGGNVRGDSDFDETVLRVDVRVPQGANCLSFDFKFLTEEYPEYVGQQFDDAFVAELDTSDWSVSGATIHAPHNFAFDASGNPISVNAAGATSVNPANAAGTTYDGATPTLRASTQVTPGSHSLYLSLFDLGDPAFDSAVFLDDLVVGKSAGSGCAAGATVAPPAAAAPPSATSRGTVLLNGAPFSAGSIPYGATVDVTNGTLELDADVGHVSLFGQGGVPARFKLARGTQTIGEKKIAVLELRLTGGNFAACGKRALAGRAKKDKPVVLLWGKAKGHFRTKARYVSATVKGTQWETDERCDGSRVFVRHGVVSVTDLVKRRTVDVRAGRSYLARP